MQNCLANVAANENNPKWEKIIQKKVPIYARNNDIRSSFERDYTRIIHSTAYRRMKHKTQVFYSPKNDHICTRIEHVVYVESISYTIAKYLGLNTELTKAIATAHDLGHSPFGHQGEKILSKISKRDIDEKFWHEKNGLDMVEKIELLEDPSGYKQNLNLTYGVRDGIISHCGEIDENRLKPRDEFIDLNEYKNLKIIFDESKNNYALFNSLKNNEITNIDNSEFIKKQIKNKVEIKNIKLAHIKDGVAMCKFIYWLKHDKGFKDELMVSDKLLQFRKEQEGFLYPSFDTICGYAAHGAIVHYSADEKSNIQVKNEGILLVDSGGQYLQGTTDITRSIVMGKVTNKMKRDFTLVLKGHLKLMSAVFKDGTRGSSLDILARGSLWDEFKDFNHGTGHGVGYFLNVHEGPNSIHYNRVNNTEMREGMLTSNEPGIYIANEYGIRHENLILCVKAKENSYGTFLKFKTVTLVPFDLSGINVRLLTKEEKKVLNQYHAEVYKKISPYLSKKEKTWLKLVTKSI